MTGFVVQGHKYKNIEMISVKCSIAVHKDSYCRMKDIDGLDCSFALLLESQTPGQSTGTASARLDPIPEPVCG